MRFNYFLAAAAVANAAVIPQIPQTKDTVKDVTSGVKSTVDGVTLPKVNAHVGRRAQANVGAKVAGVEPKVGVTLGRRVNTGAKVNLEGVTYDNVNVTVDKGINPKVGASVGRRADANVDAKVNALGPFTADAAAGVSLNKRLDAELEAAIDAKLEALGVSADASVEVKLQALGLSVDASVEAKLNALGLSVDADVDAKVNARQTIPNVNVPKVDGLVGDVTSGATNGVKSTVDVSFISMSLISFL